ncbi:MAG TPA: YciI family protein [Burkholderiaceae bacterium]|nr:YciI family protein [Burkholderiaceae bacterium]
MTLFAVWATDAAGALPARERVRPVHRARLRAPGPVRVVLAGPTPAPLDARMNGTLLIVEAEDLQAVQDFIERDPYSEAGVYERVEIRPFVCGLGPLAPSS